MTTTPKFLTCFAVLLMAAVTVGATSVRADHHDIPDEQPKAPSAPVEKPSAETP